MAALLALLAPNGLTRWHATSASVFLEANAGLQYVFGDVSGSLRSRLGYTQRQIDGLGTAKVRPPQTRVGAGLRRCTHVAFCCRWRQPAQACAARTAARLTRSRGFSQDCGTAVVDVMAGFTFDHLGAPATLVFIAVSRSWLENSPTRALTVPLPPRRSTFRASSRCCWRTRARCRRTTRPWRAQGSDSPGFRR